MDKNLLTVAEARKNDQLREQFIQQNKKFILGCAYKAVKHFVTESDDEWSVALIAFNEAIDAYEDGKGSFEGFASLVIKRRLVDHIRSEARFSGEISTEPYVMDGDLDEEDPTAFQMEVRKKAGELSVEDIGSLTIKDEIEAVQEVLKGYGFSFFDLTECSPKAEKTKKSCAVVMRVLLERKDLIEKMRSNHTLPIKELCEMSKVPRKILERHRRYIIAAAEILKGDYPLLSEYLKSMKGNTD